MSTATVHYTHTTAGWDIAAQILPKGLPNKSRTTAQCSGWTAQDSSYWPNRSTDANSSNALCSEWTGAESRIVLQDSSIRRVYEAKKFVLICAGPAGGIIHLRPAARSSSFSRSLVHRLYSAPRVCSIWPSSISDTRVAYGYFLGPTYGYGGGFGSSSILVFIVLGFIALQAFQSLASDGSLTRSREKVSVLKLQVGLLGFARTLQNDLERIADRADTSTSRGLHYVLTETVLALLRQPDMCILGTSLCRDIFGDYLARHLLLTENSKTLNFGLLSCSPRLKRGVEAGERRFNQLSLEERGKFDEETLVNVDGNRKRVQEKIRGDGFRNEYIVVTLLVAADGDYSLPAIYDNNDLKEALKKLGSIPADKIQGWKFYGLHKIKVTL